MTEEFGMEEALEQSQETKTGSVVEGYVVGLSDSYLMVDVGLKLEACLPTREFGAQPIPKSGDKISVLLIRMSGPEGHPLVSWKQAKERLHWDRIAEVFKANQPIEGKITQRIKGGVTVDIGLDAFMPASQIDDRPVHKPEEWVGKSVQVLVLEMDRTKGNVLVSRRKILEAEKNVKRAQTLEGLKIDQVVKGRVTGLTNFGAFVDIGGVEGLLHNTDLAWGRVESPKGHVKVGDEFDVKVLKFDTATKRISLGRKQLMPHPWDGIESRYPIGTKITGKVRSLAAFGGFVEIAPGIEGLIHVSELSWTEDIKDPKKVLKAGQTVETVIIAVDRSKEKISLSLKRVQANPWQDVAKSHPVGSQVEGEVTHIVNFGAFVRIAPGVEALLKTQDLSWTERYSSPSQVLKVGDKIKTVVLDIDLKSEKMSLGLKQLSSDPMKHMKIGQIVTGTVSKTTDFGMFVKLDSGVDGLVRSNEVQLKRSIFSDPEDRFKKEPVESPYKEGEKIQAVVSKVNRKERKLELSIRRFEQQEERDLLKKYSGHTSNPTLGEATGWTDAASDEE